MTESLQTAAGFVAVAGVAVAAIYGLRVAQRAGAPSAGILWAGALGLWCIHGAANSLALAGWLEGPGPWRILVQPVAAAALVASVRMWSRAMSGKGGELARLRARTEALEARLRTARLREELTPSEETPCDPSS